MVSHTKKRCPKGRKRCKRSKKGSQKGGNPPTEEQRQKLLQNAINEEVRRREKQSKRVENNGKMTVNRETAKAARKATEKKSKTFSRTAFKKPSNKTLQIARAAAAARNATAGTGAAAIPTFPGSTRHNRRNNKKAIYLNVTQED